MLTRLFFIFVLLNASSTVLTAQHHSKLWEKKGESWDPKGLLRDFTDVGYKLGKEPIPDWPLWKNITEFGAIPNDKISDLEALKKAIAACPPKNAIGIPNGRFIIDDGFDVSASDIVIRGESRDGAILFFPKHLKEIRPGYRSYFPSFIRFKGGKNRGMENLSLVLRDEQKATGYVPPPPEVKKQRARHWYYSGENLVSFSEGETDSWLRNVYLKNGNNVIRITGQGTKQITLQDLVLDNFIHRKMPEDGTVGHMGIVVLSAASRCLVHNILLTGIYSHDICPMGARHCVFSRISGPNMELDHHAMRNYGNLFTEIDTGYGNRGYGESHNNKDETYWGIKGIKEKRITGPDCRNVMVGLTNNHPNDFGKKHWHENIDPNKLVPANLFLAQLEFKKRRLPKDKKLTLPPLAEGTPVRLLPVDDSSTHVGNAKEEKFGYSGRIKIRKGYKSNTTEGFFKFDLSAYDKKNLAKATLKLHAVSAPGNKGFPLRIEYVKDDSWQEETITGANQPAADKEIALPDLKGPGWHEIDLTAFINEQLQTGDPIISLKLSGRSKASPLNLTSKEGYNFPHMILHFDQSTVAPPAAPTDIKVTKLEDGLYLDWKDNTEADLHAYKVYRKTKEGEWKLEAMGLITSDYKDGVVKPGASYTYRIKAVDTAGTESEPSVEFTAKF